MPAMNIDFYGNAVIIAQPTDMQRAYKGPIKMTIIAENNLQRSYSIEEQDKMIESYAEAIRTGDEAEADRILDILPLDPDWAMSIATVMGGDFLERNFNITDATKKFGKGWLNDK